MADLALTRTSAISRCPARAQSCSPERTAYATERLFPREVERRRARSRPPRRMRTSKTGSAPRAACCRASRSGQTATPIVREFDITSKNSMSSSGYVCFLRISKDRMIRTAAPKTGNDRVLRPQLVRDVYSCRALVARSMGVPLDRGMDGLECGRAGGRFRGDRELACAGLARALDSARVRSRIHFHAVRFESGH